MVDHLPLIDIALADAESRASIGSTSSSPVQPTLAALQAHDSSMSEDSVSFQSAGSISLSSASSSQLWQNAGPESQGSTNLDWFDPGDQDSDSAVSAVSAASSSQTSAESQKGAAGTAILQVQATASELGQHDPASAAQAAGVSLTYSRAAADAPGSVQQSLVCHGLLIRFNMEVCQADCLHKATMLFLMCGARRIPGDGSEV